MITSGSKDSDEEKISDFKDEGVVHFNHKNVVYRLGSNFSICINYYYKETRLW